MKSLRSKETAVPAAPAAPPGASSSPVIPEGEFALVTKKEKVVVFGHEVVLMIPKSEWADFEAWAMSRPTIPSRLDIPGVHLMDQLCFALRNQSPGEEEWFWDRPYNKPWGMGILSDKARLSATKRLLRREKRNILTFTVEDRLFRKCEARAAHRGISVGEHILSCISYYAALWRGNQPKPKPKPSPFQSFEKHLSKEHRASRPEKQKGRIRSQDSCFGR